jgi:NodT family efflux transporter outer membrane factor (OMF) lipoprotein
VAWWQVFHDPVLDQLMRIALAQNLDLKLAQARIAQARAQQHAATANLFPNYTLSGTDQRVHNPTLPGGFPETTLYAALEGSWNVDLFGQARDERRAAIAAADASQFDRDETEVTLLAEVATDYLQYRLFQLEYEISQTNAASQAETVRITELRFTQGAASRLDVEQLRSQLAITRAAVPAALEQAESARQALILLLASTPAALAQDLPEQVPPNPSLPSADPVTVLLTPAQVLAQRPDIRAAKLRVLSAGASLRAAEAQRFPQVSIAGAFGREATDWTSFASQHAWSYSIGLTLPIFDFGRIRANIDQANAQQQQAYVSFEQTVRTALEATQTAIVLYTQGMLRAQQLQIALKSAQTAEQLARRQYQQGALALLNVLDAQRTAYATQLTWAEAAAAVSVRLVTLYETMGVLPPENEFQARNAAAAAPLQ